MRPYFKDVSDPYSQSPWQPLPPTDELKFQRSTKTNPFPECLLLQDRSPNCFELCFTHKFTSMYRTYFAHSEPFSYTDCQTYLNEMERKLVNNSQVYFCRELLTHTLEGRRVDLLTITSFKDLTYDREPQISGLFPLNN